ncbi:hypothetical protein FOZ62_018536, partial [Perkinsus olseni]
MRVDPLFTTPTLVSAPNINENLMGSRRAVRGKEDQENTTIQLIQPSANCAYLTTFEAGHTSAKEVASLQLGGQRFSLEPRGNTSDNVIRLCYFASESKEVRVASLSTEDGRIDDSARCKVDESVRCIEWLSSNSIIVLCKDTVLELTSDPLEILRSSRIDAPRHSHTCRIRSREGADELLVYGTGGLSVFSPSVNGIRCARRFLCSGRVTAAAQLDEGIIVCRIEAHEQGDGSGGTSMNSLGQSASLDRLMMPDGSALPALPLDSSKEFAVTLPTTVFLCVLELADAERRGAVSLPVVERARIRIDHQYKWLEGAPACTQPLFATAGSALPQARIYRYEGSSITLIQTVDLEEEFTSWGATSRIRGLTFLGTSRVSLLVATTDEGDTEADDKQPFAWAQKTKAPAQWDAVTFRVQGSALDSPSLDPSIATEEALEPGSAATTSQLCAEVASLRWEMDQMRDTVLVGKVIVVGPASVGKTCLVTRFVDDVFDANTQSTLGCDSKEKTLNVTGVAEPIKLILFDTAGQERFAQLAGSYYRQADVGTKQDLAPKLDVSFARRYANEN